MASSRRIAASKKRAFRRKKKAAEFAAGTNSFDDRSAVGPYVATPAAWLKATTVVHDYRYVEDEYGVADLVKHAQQRLLWGRNVVWTSSNPLSEALVRLDLAIDHVAARDREKKRKQGHVAQKKETVQESGSVSTSGVSREEMRAAREPRGGMSDQQRPVQALLETGVLRASRNGIEEGGVVTHPPELKDRAKELRAEGLLIREIAAIIEVPTTTVIRWLNPELEARERARARRKKFSAKKRCPKCKRMMSNNAQMCQVCFNKAQKYWTRKRVIEAIQKWAIERGAAPTYREWILSGPGHPAIWTVIDGKNPAFPSWSEAIKASGFVPRQRRGPGRMAPKERAEMRRKAREDAIKRAVAKENT